MADLSKLAEELIGLERFHNDIIDWSGSNEGKEIVEEESWGRDYSGTGV